MGRPRKTDDDSRTVFVGVRVTEAERAALASAAARSGLSLSAYLRASGLSAFAAAATPARRSLDWPALDQLRRIGVNLNQAVRVANAKGVLPPELSRAAAAVEAFLMREIGSDGPEGRR